MFRNRSKPLVTLTGAQGEIAIDDGTDRKHVHKSAVYAGEGDDPAIAATTDRLAQGGGAVGLDLEQLFRAVQREQGSVAVDFYTEMKTVYMKY